MAAHEQHLVLDITCTFRVEKLHMICKPLPLCFGLGGIEGAVRFVAPVDEPEVGRFLSTL